MKFSKDFRVAPPSAIDQSDSESGNFALIETTLVFSADLRGVLVLFVAPNALHGESYAQNAFVCNKKQ